MFVLSCTAAGVAHVVHHPLYTLKSHMMMHGSEFNPRIFVGNVWSNPKFLYRGLIARTFGVMPEKGFKMQAWYIADKLMKKHYKNATLTNWLIAGSFAGLATTIIGCPSERIMVIAQIRKQGIWEVIRSAGLRGLYKGAAVTACRDISFNAVFFTMTEVLVRSYMAYTGKEENSFLRYKAGLIAGMIAATVACPLDVAKTRIQGQKLGEPKLGMLQVFQSIIRDEGPRYLFKGLLPRLIAVPSMMSFFYMLNVKFNKWFSQG